MASKRRIPLEALYASASSDDDDSEQSDIEEKQEQQQHDAVEEEEEDEDESESEEEGVEEEKSSEKNSTVTPATNQPKPNLPSGSGSGSESDSESDVESDKTPPSPNVSDFTIRPISSKPMKDSDKPTKPESKPNKKRALETESLNQEVLSTKKQKTSSNGNEEDNNGVEENAKKGSGIQRLWSSNDEMAILKGMMDYQSEKGIILYSDMDAFHEFIKKSLQVDVSKNQLLDKIRRLKKKYQTNVGKGENGEDPVFAKPHEGKSFELSKKIWGYNNDVKKNNAVNGSIKNKRKSNNDVNVESVLALPVQEGEVKQHVVSNWGVKREKKKEVGSFGSSYPCLNEVVESGKFFDLSVPMKSVMKETISSIKGSKVNELEKKWKKLMVDEAELYLKKVELIEEQTKLILDAMKTSTSMS